MNIQISSDHLYVISQMILIRGLSITPQVAILEMLADDINDIERTLHQLKELKQKQQQLINRPKLYVVK